MIQPLSERIISTDGIRGGKPCIAGTRISVSDIVIWSEQGQSPDEIVNDFPHLTLSDVHAALAFYYANQLDIDQQIRDSEKAAEEWKRKLEDTASTNETSNDGDSVSS